MPANGLPVPASARAYLRRGLPAVYADDPGGGNGEPFAMRFVRGLEEVVDPIVAVLDLLPAHLDMRIAPPDAVTLVGAWLGLELDSALTPDAKRRLVRHATEITRARGTLAGVELVLELAFPELDVRASDGGRATWSTDRRTLPAGERTLTIELPAGVAEPKRAAIRRFGEELKPAGVALVLTEGRSA